MATPPGNALPIIQTLAGLFSGLMQAKQQEQANPRYGFSLLPILAGGAQGLASGLSGAATRAETMRQEGRSRDDALAQYALQSGMSLDELKQRMGGLLPTEYRGDVGGAVRQGAGNMALAQQMNIANPSGLYSADSGTLGSLLGTAQKQLADRATANALPNAQLSGLHDAGGNGTLNAITPPGVPSLASMIAPQHRALMGALGLGDGATPTDQTLGNVLRGSVSMQPRIKFSPVASDGGVDMGYPKTLGQIAMMAKDPAALTAQYSASASAANARNTQMTSLTNTANTITGANQRAILDYEKPTIAGIIANGSPQQQSTLMQYADAGSTKLQGTAKPPTRGEIAGAAKQVSDSPTKDGRIAAARRAVETNTLTPEQAVAAANSIWGTRDPVSLSDIQPTPAAVSAPAGTLPNVAPGNGPAVAPRLSDFMPTNAYPNIQMVQKSSMGAVNKKARENNGAPGRRNARNYGY